MTRTDRMIVCKGFMIKSVNRNLAVAGGWNNSCASRKNDYRITLTQSSVVKYCPTQQTHMLKSLM